MPALTTKQPELPSKHLPPCPSAIWFQARFLLSLLGEEQRRKYSDIQCPGFKIVGWCTKSTRHKASSEGETAFWYRSVRSWLSNNCFAIDLLIHRSNPERTLDSYPPTLESLRLTPVTIITSRSLANSSCVKVTIILHQSHEQLMYFSRRPTEKSSQIAGTGTMPFIQPSGGISCYI